MGAVLYRVYTAGDVCVDLCGWFPLGLCSIHLSSLQRHPCDTLGPMKQNAWLSLNYFSKYSFSFVYIITTFFFDNHSKKLQIDPNALKCFLFKVHFSWKTAFRMGENNGKQSSGQRINPKNIQATPTAQFQKNKRPNQNVGQRTKQTFLQRRHTEG